MNIRASQEIPTPIRNIELRMPDQFNRLNVRTTENGQNSGDSNKYVNFNNPHKVSHEVQAQNNHANLQLCHQHKDSKIVDEKERKDLLKFGDMVKNRWRISYKIGGGGFGEIYQALDTQMDPEKIGQGDPDLTDLCSSCSIKGGNYIQRHTSAIAMTPSESDLRRHHCSRCGREFFSPSATFIRRAGIQRKFSEDGLESADSGNSSGHSERGSVPDNYVVAVKAESNTQSKQMLHMEVAVLRRLKGKKNFCDLITCGKTQRINYIVMTLQGKNLSDLRKKAPNRSFSHSTSLRIICKCLDALEELHNIGYLHRDIKPSNFCLRRDDPMEICLLDFGLVRPFIRPGTTNQVRPPRPSAGFRGTVRYASINAHEYRELGRHDDLWSMYYMLVEFLRGELPWQRKSGKNLVKQMKLETEPVNLGKESGLPPIIATTWVHELKSLNYFLKPNYRELRRVIEVWLLENRMEWNDPYDWQKQSMVRAESDVTFTPLFKRNQVSGRQFVQNIKRPVHHDSTGCLRRLDRRGFGSTGELKRFDTEEAEGGTTALGGKSTAAVCEDATTNKNMATEKIMQEDGHENFEDASEKMDGKEKILGSHSDLHVSGDEQRKATENADRQFLANSKGLDTEKQGANTNLRQKFLSVITLGRKKPGSEHPLPIICASIQHNSYPLSSTHQSIHLSPPINPHSYTHTQICIQRAKMGSYHIEEYIKNEYVCPTSSLLR
uniref:non-specific serine/threonine protein kinase n=1 Tax=Echinococcus granulosus TaxID=6210 RepID=A0A068WUY5_ECHGR|nr:tau tubulin kinase 1 [Echinococcus granulosus]